MKMKRAIKDDPRKKNDINGRTDFLAAEMEEMTKETNADGKNDAQEQVID